jgi:2-iminobutanoate/2-iminopropanoate deaminase
VRKQGIHTDKAPSPAGAYSQAIRYGDLLFTAQIGPIDAVTREVVARGDIAAQTRKTIDNLREVLEAAGSSLERVVKVTAYIDVSQWQAFDDTYAECFADGVRPARSIVALPKDSEMLVALDIIAHC